MLAAPCRHGRRCAGPPPRPQAARRRRELGARCGHGRLLRRTLAAAAARPTSPLRPEVISSTIWLVLLSLRDLGSDPAEVEGVDAVGDLHDVVHVVRDQHDPNAVIGQAADEVEHLAGLRDAEGRGRLVEEDDLAVPQHCLRDRHCLPLATGEAGDQLADRVDRAYREAGQRLACLAFHLAVGEERAGWISRPRNMFWVMSRLSASARSW